MGAEEEERVANMLQAHVDSSNLFRETMLKEISEIKTDFKYTSKTLQQHQDTINELQTAHNKVKGALWLLGGLGVAATICEEIVRHFIK